MNYIPLGQSDSPARKHVPANNRCKWNKPTASPAAAPVPQISQTVEKVHPVHETNQASQAGSASDRSTARSGEKKRKRDKSAGVDGESVVRREVKKKKVFKGPAIIRLHNEIESFYNEILPTKDEKAQRLKVVSRITEVIKKLWSSAKVELFGSFVTGLYLPTSDVDMVVFGRWSAKPLFTLKQALVRQGICTEQAVQVLDKASVPLIKVRETLTQVKVDISFNMTNGQNTARMIQGWVKEFPALAPLVMVLKQFLYQRDLNEVYTGGLSSYSLILLIVSFLQLQCRGDTRRADVNYGVLLMEFFELYGVNFNYTRTGISVRGRGCYINKPEQGGGSAQMSLYIEDPISPENDVGRGSYNLQQIQASFCHAYHVLAHRLTSGGSEEERGGGASLLSSILPSASSPASNHRQFDSDDDSE